MEYCSKCGKKLPKILGFYIDTCYKEDEKLICDTCYHKGLAEFAENSKRIMKLRETTPNNGCCKCGAKDTKIFDDKALLWYCEKCFYVTEYGETKAAEILKGHEEARNKKTFGRINLYVKEREFEIVPFFQRYKVDDVISYELIENGYVGAKGGFGGAVLGNMIAGTTGALIGYDKGKKAHNMCSEYRLSIRIKGKAPAEIAYIGGGTNVAYDSAEFMGYKREATATIAGIEYILDMAEKEKNKNTTSEQKNSTSIADEIIKLKNLLDEGIITKTEFEKAKEKLLNNT